MAKSSRQNPKPIPYMADSRKNEAYAIPVVTSVNLKGASRLGYPVDVVWPGNHRRGMLQYSPEDSYPTLVMDGKEYEAPELPKGCKVVVIWREVRTGPVWELMHRAMTIGQFPIEILETDRDEGMYRLMTEITLLKSQLTQKDGEVSDLRKEITSLRSQVSEKDRQIVELHTLLGRAQKASPNTGKKPWSMFWKG